MNIRHKKQPQRQPTTTQQAIENTQADSLVELQGLLKTREELLRLSLTHYSTAFSAIVFPFLFKVIVFDGMTLAILLGNWLEKKHQHDLSNEVMVHQENYQNAKDTYEKFISDSLNDPSVIQFFGKSNSIKEFAEKLDDFYQKHSHLSSTPLKNRFLDTLSALAAFSSHEALDPYFKKMSIKTSYLAYGNLELHVSHASPDLLSKSFTSLYGLIEIAKEDFDFFGKAILQFASPGFYIEVTEYSKEIMDWVTPGSLIAIGILGKYFIADPLISRLYNNYREKPFQTSDRPMTAKELHSLLSNPNQQFLQPGDIELLNWELTIRNKELDKKAETSIKIGTGIIVAMASIAAIGYSYGGYEVYVIPAGACTLITTLVNGYTYLSRSYLRWDLERNISQMALNLNNMTYDCQQNLWTVIPGQTLLTTQFNLDICGWKVASYKPLHHYTVRQAIINTLKTFGINNIRTTLRKEKKAKDTEEDEVKVSPKWVQAKLIVGADPTLLDYMSGLKKILGKNIGSRLNAHFKLSLGQHSSLRLLQSQIFKLTKALECEDTLIRIPGLDAKKLPENTYMFLIPTNLRSLLTPVELIEIFPQCRTELLADNLQVVINGYSPAAKNTWPAFIANIHKKKALLRTVPVLDKQRKPSQEDSKHTKIRAITKTPPAAAKSWNPLKHFGFFNRTTQPTLVPTIKWKKVNAFYPLNPSIKPVRYSNLHGRLFIRFSLPKKAFPDHQSYEQARRIVEVDPHIVQSKGQQGIKFIKKSSGKLVRDLVNPKGGWFIAAASVKIMGKIYGQVRAYAEGIISEDTKEVLLDVRGLELKK